MKTVFRNFGKFFVTAILLGSLSGCIVVDIKGAGVFRDRSLYQNIYNPEYAAYIDIPSGIYVSDKDRELWSNDDGSRIRFEYLGKCGGGAGLVGVMLPFIPFFHLNHCDKDDFMIGSKGYFDALGVSVQMRRDGKIHDPYFDVGESYVQGKIFKRDWVKFKIENFSAFKKAKDKTIIIHKRKPDGSMFTKELPFDWKVVVETSGSGL